MSAQAVARVLAGGAVVWEGTDLGLLPVLTAEDEAAAAELDDGDVPALLHALDDADTFVKAHVLLTRVTGVLSETSPTWNGLAVDIAADGSAHVDPAQRSVVAERWRRWSAGRNSV